VIRPNIREKLGRKDAQLALQLISQGSREEYDVAEKRLRDEGINALLDDQRLFPALMQHHLGANASLSLFLCAAVRAAMRRMGESDATVSDYVAALLLHFGMRDRALRISETDDQTYSTAAEIVADVDDHNPTRAFHARAHMGNYALWLSGVFPDYIEQRRLRRGGPDLDYYEEMGRTGFMLAADSRIAAEHNVAQLFRHVAERFMVLRIALNNLSDTLLYPTYTSPDRLLRQVRDEFRWRLTH
jgi:hypothetical protein